jgi:hypothetical protein
LKVSLILILGKTCLRPKHAAGARGHVAGVSVMIEAALIIEKTFDEVFRFVVKAKKEGVP